MNFAKLHEDICFRHAGGKVIWQPRIDCWIADRLFANGELPGKYKGMFYASKPFVAYKTINILIHKDALPKDIAKKLGIK